MYFERVNGKCEITIVLILALVVAIFLQIQILGLRNDQNEQPEYSDVTSLYDLTRKGAVEILVDGRLEGSGWFVDSSGLVMTADHVIGLPGKTIEIVSHSVGRVEAQVVARTLARERSQADHISAISRVEIDAPHRRVVARRGPDEQVTRSISVQFAHHVRELARGELAASTSAVAELSESVLDVVGHKESRRIVAAYLGRFGH